MNIALEIPLSIGNETFGGILGSRIQADSNRAVVQIAYLEKGCSPRVRFIETELDNVLNPIKLLSITARDVGQNLVLEVQIESKPEK